MNDTKDTPKIVERALLVGAYIDTAEKHAAQSLLDELGELVDTLGIPIIERMLVFHREQHAKYLIGSGKAEEIAALVKEHALDVVVFDNELSPSQQRNWEALTGVAVIDRQEVILDIFGKRAKTREARLQVELAKLQYSMPRLTRAWGHLVRQGGGIGAKGEGESQLEQDKRRIRGAIDRCKRELITVKEARATQRKDRQRTPVPNCAIVGYTNSGKSSLLRRFTGADVLVENKLFATLDTTTRKVALPNHQPLLLTDTVGFVRKLPHRLVEAFNATLEEAAMADFLIHLLDASQPGVVEFFNTTLKVLAELGADAKPTIIAFNKIDKVEDPAVLAGLRQHFPDALFLSVHTGEGIEALTARMSDHAASGAAVRTLRMPQSAAGEIARLHRIAKVIETKYEGEEVWITALLPARLAEEFAGFLVSDGPEKAMSNPNSLATS